MKFKLLFIYVLLPYLVFSQAKLKGTVYFLNSNKTPVANIEVGATNANSVFTKSDGNFTINFVNNSIGETVNTWVGKKNQNITDGQNQVLELVNENEITYINLPKDPSVSPLRIIVCKKGQRDEAARKYYKILRDNSEDALQKKQKELNEYKQRLGMASAVVLEKENKLKQYKIAYKDTIETFKEAMSIASINTDFASQRINEYLNLLNAGISIDEARKVLSTAKAYKAAKAGENSILSSIEEITQEAKALKRVFQYEKAIQKRDTLSLLLSNKLYDRSYEIKNIIYKALLYKKLGRNDIAIKLLKSNENVFKNYKNKRLSNINNKLMSILYGDLNRKEKIKYSIKVANFQKNNTTLNGKLEYANTLSSIALNYSIILDSVNEFKYYNKAVRIYKDLANEDQKKYGLKLVKYYLDLKDSKSINIAGNLLDKYFDTYKTISYELINLKINILKQKGEWGELEIFLLALLTEFDNYFKTNNKVDVGMNKFKEELLLSFVKQQKNERVNELFNELEINYKNDFNELIRFYKLTADYYIELKEPQKAKQYLNKSIFLINSSELKENFNYRFQLADIFFDYAEIEETYIKDYESSLGFLQKALNIYLDLESIYKASYNRRIPICYLNLATCALRSIITQYDTIKIKNGIKYSDLGLEYLKKHNSNIVKNEDLLRVKKQLMHFSDMSYQEFEYSKLMNLTVYKLKDEIEKSNDYNNKLSKQNLIINKLKEFLNSNPNYNTAEIELLYSYGNLAWYALFCNKYQLAEKSALEGIALSPEKGEWIYTNLALAYLLQGKYDEAEKIYLQYKDKLKADSKTLYKETFLADLNDLEKAGITHKDFKKIKILLNK